jgi:hypothetical protein
MNGTVSVTNTVIDEELLVTGGLPIDSGIKASFVSTLFDLNRRKKWRDG